MHHCRIGSYLGHFAFECLASAKQKTAKASQKLLARFTPTAGLVSSRLIREESGQSTILAALFIGFFLLGFMALGLDVGFLFHEKRMAQAAADAAAVAAAEELSEQTPGNEQAAANAMAKMNGFDPTPTLANHANVIVTPLSTGSFGTGSFLQVNVSKPFPTFFLDTFQGGSPLMTVSASAIAGGGQTSPTCLCVEAPTGAGLTMSNNAGIVAPKCGVTVDSTSNNAVSVIGSASISALSLGTASTTWDNSSNVNGGGTLGNTDVVTGVGGCSPPPPQTPSATLPSSAVCNANPVTKSSTAYSLPLSTDSTSNGNFVCYSSLDTSAAGGGSVTFKSGFTYYVQGDFTTGGGAPLSGSNVQFYVGGNVNIGNGVTINLSAPTDANNIPETLIYANGPTVQIQGGSSSSFSGLLYAPTSAVTLSNGTGTSFQLDMVANTLTMEGGAVLDGFAIPGLGTLSVSTARLVQ